MQTMEATNPGNEVTADIHRSLESASREQTRQTGNTDHTEELIERLTVIALERRRAIERIQRIAAGGILTAGISLVGAYALLESSTPAVGISLLIAAPLLSSLLLVFSMRSRAPKRTLLSMVKELAKRSDPKALGTLILLLGYDSRKVCSAARAALIGILPTCGEEHLAALTEPQRRAIRHIVSGVVTRRSLFYLQSMPGELRANADLRVALCEMLGRVGSPEFSQSLRVCTGIPALTRPAERVQSAAEQALLSLTARMSAMESHNLLLRASDVPKTEAEHLLRAVGAPGASGADELLRAGAMPGVTPHFREETGALSSLCASSISGDAFAEAAREQNTAGGVAHE